MAESISEAAAHDLIERLVSAGVLEDHGDKGICLAPDAFRVVRMLCVMIAAHPHPFINEYVPAFRDVIEACSALALAEER